METAPSMAFENYVPKQPPSVSCGKITSATQSAPECRHRAWSCQRDIVSCGSVCL